MVNGIFISPRESEAGANHRGFPALPPELKSFWLYSPARLLQCKAAAMQGCKNEDANLPKNVPDG